MNEVYVIEFFVICLSCSLMYPGVGFGRFYKTSSSLKIVNDSMTKTTVVFVVASEICSLKFF